MYDVIHIHIYIYIGVCISVALTIELSAQAYFVNLEIQLCYTDTVKSPENKRQTRKDRWIDR